MKNSSSIYISFGDLEHIYIFQNFVLDDIHDHSVTLLEIGVMSYWCHSDTLHKHIYILPAVDVQMQAW